MVANVTGMVMRFVRINSEEAQSSVGAQRAIEREVENYNDVLDYENAMGHVEVVALHPDAEFVEAHGILGIKKAEEEMVAGGSEGDWKFRIVAVGNNVKDVYRQQVVEHIVQEVPASLPEVKFGMTYGGFFNPSEARHGDMRGVYLTSILGGKPKFLRIPPYLRHKIPKRRRFRGSPYARVKRAMCGFIRAGADFADRVRRKVVAMGWIRVRDAVMGVYFRGKVVMIVYSDDLFLVGPRVLVIKHFDGLHATLKFSDKSYADSILRNFVGIHRVLMKTTSRSTRRRTCST